MVGHLLESQAPLNYKQLNRMRISLKDEDDEGRFDERGNEYKFSNEILGVMGMRAVDVDPAKGMIYKVSELQKEKDLQKIYLKDHL